MALAAGTRLGPYELIAPAGAGGMGEVYRARDTRLDRIVAIKILSEHLSERPEARDRFDREARAISSLSHANICHLYDVGRQDGISYLVMEYLDGETLADRLRSGPLPLGDVLKIGMEICDGLEKAHRSGVVHRDLKPRNIMLTNSGAKLMDFGLAKAMTGNSPNAALAQTLVTPNRPPLTTDGTVVGTFEYMSPEQVEGKEADARSDLFSLGAVLYEMVTGKRAFEGRTPASTMAAILAADPPAMSSVQPMSPPALDHVVRVCLAKNPDDRWQGAHDVKVQLQWIAAGGSQTGAPAMAVRKRWDLIGWWIAGLLMLLILAGSAVWWLGSRSPQRTMYFSSVFPFPANNLALSPDGRTLVMVAYWDQENTYVIWTYQVGARSMSTVQGTEGASYPFWSADGKSIAFFAQGKLKKVSASGGPAQVLCDAPIGRGGTWNRDGVILFAPDVFSGIYRVSSGGGTAVEVTRRDNSRFEQSHRWPVFLPDGRHFLYTVANFGGRFEINAVYLGSLDSNEKRLIIAASSNAAYADPGYLLYWRDGVLVAQKFDPDSYTLKGDPHTVSDDVQYLPQVDLALFAVAGKDTLVLQTGKGGAKSQLTWFDRSGRSLGTVGPPGYFANPRLSPDGRRVAFDQVEDRNVDIWIRDLASDAATRFTFGPSLQDDAVWSPDGKRIMFSANRTNWFRLYEKNTDGSGPERQLADLGADQQLGWDWSRDGKYVLARKKNELWYVTMPDRQIRPLFQPPWLVRDAQFSPDGKWVAYASNETGSFEIFVSPFPNANSKWQVSSNGGDEPRWRADGKELFYLSPAGKMMAVTIATGNGFVAGPPVALFQTRRWQLVSAQDVFSYDVTADGRRFLVNAKVDEHNATPLSVILNWTSDLEK